MKVSLLFPSEYIRCDDLDGRDVNLHVARVQMDTLKTERGSERKPVVFFQEMEARHRQDRTKDNKKLVLNVTNAKTIAKLYGNETDDWAGKPITLFGTTCEAFGETVTCIRVRPDAPRPKRAAEEPLSEEEQAELNAHT